MKHTESESSKRESVVSAQAHRAKAVISDKCRKILAQVMTVPFGCLGIAILIIFWIIYTASPKDKFPLFGNFNASSNLTSLDNFTYGKIIEYILKNN